LKKSYFGKETYLFLILISWIMTLLQTKIILKTAKVVTVLAHYEQ